MSRSFEVACFSKAPLTLLHNLLAGKEKYTRRSDKKRLCAVALVDKKTTRPILLCSGEYLIVLAPERKKINAKCEVHFLANEPETADVTARDKKSVAHSAVKQSERSESNDGCE